jgi:catecholate siderophore receptor
MNDAPKVRWPAYRRSPIALAVLAALHAAAGQAQTATNAAPASQLPRISVSGEGEETGIKAERVDSAKFTQPLLETPQTVTVVRKEVILQQGAASLTDTLRNVPGITFQLGENGNTQSGDTIFMRGFDAQNAIFLDGIRDSSPAVRDVFNLEQVEVFKGPAGADNGRGATSGYINLVSKLPTATSASSGTLAYGTNERRRLTADWNQAIGETSAFRLNAMGQGGGVAGRDFIERESWAIAPSFALGLGTDTRFYAFAQHVEQDNTPDGAVPTIGISDWANDTLLAAAPDAPTVDEETFYGLSSDFEDIQADMLSLRVEHDFSDNTTLRNSTRYSRTEQERLLTTALQAPIVSTTADPSTWTLNRSRHGSFRENELLTNQTNIITRFATGSIQHSLATGVEFIYESQYTPTMGGFGTLAPTNLYNPNRNGEFTVAPGPIVPTGTFNDGNTVTSAVYAFDTWELSPKWEITTGLRFEHYDTETDGVTVTTTNNVSTTTASRVSVTDNLLSWKVAALYKPTVTSSVYAAVANSYKPPGSDNFTLTAANATNANNSSVDPQKALNLELGTKWDLLNGRLAATAALFHSTNENDLVRSDVDPNFVIQYGEREVKGIELGLVGQVTDAWQISAGVTRQDTEVTEGSIPASGGPSTQTGADINFSPKLSATLWTTYRIIPSLTVGGGARHISTSSRSVSNIPITAGVFELPSFTVVDLYANYQATQNIGIQLNAYNIFDEDYVAMINNSGQRYNAGIPLSYLATVNFTF